MEPKDYLIYLSVVLFFYILARTGDKEKKMYLTKRGWRKR